MIHQYKLNGYNIVLDVYSGSVHCVDEIAYDMIAMYEANDKQTVIDAMMAKYGEREDVTERVHGGTDTDTTRHTGADTTTLTHGEQIATSGTTSKTESVTTGDTRTIGTDTTKDHTGSGYQGISPSKLLEEYRKTFLNVDMQVIASIDKLFFGLWG